VVTAKKRGSKSAARTPGVKVSDRTIQRLKEVFELLADKSRLKIVLALAQQGEMHVSALCELLGEPSRPASQPAVSHHLSLMRRTGLVGYRRDGKHNYYHVDSAMLCELLEQFFTDAGNGHKQLQFEDFCLAYKRN
jgi:ArsR family transcriptional regulator